MPENRDLSLAEQSAELQTRCEAGITDPNADRVAGT